MEMLEERSWLVDRREETQEERADAILVKEPDAQPTLRGNGITSLDDNRLLYFTFDILEGCRLLRLERQQRFLKAASSKLQQSSNVNPQALTP